MKKILRLATLMFVSINLVNAQIDGNSKIAPNFNGFDINSVQYDFYSYLDSGIPIILDVSAHWCPPCWSYHQTHVLEDLYNQYGPSGTVAANSVMVFMADGDANSTMAELTNVGLSSGQSTMGDWVTGTSYPIFGGETGPGANAGATIANLYEISYFPTIYIIHPDRTVEEIGQVSSVAAIMNLVNAATPVSTTSNDARVFRASSSASACPGESVTVDYSIKNMGTTDLTAATIEVELDGSVINTINWTGTLQQYEMEPATEVVSNLTEGNHTINIKIVDANGGTDDETSNNEQAASVNVVVTEAVEYTITVTTDSYGDETDWSIKKSNGQIAARKNDYQSGAYGNNGTFTHTITLSDDDCYELVVTDAYSDGIVNGGVTLEDNNNVMVADIDGDFGGEGTGSWKKEEATTTNGIQTLANSSLVSVYPNPITHVVNLDLNLVNASNVSVRITNVLGAVIFNESYSYNAGTNLTQINTDNLKSGVYMLDIYIDNEKVTQKLVK